MSMNLECDEKFKNNVRNIPGPLECTDSLRGGAHSDTLNELRHCRLFEVLTWRNKLQRH